MMDLIFWRHAEACELLAGHEDKLRPLTPRGEKQALRMAAWLDRQLPEGTRILASPTVRTEQTVRALCRDGRNYKLRAELGTQGVPAEILELVKWPQRKQPTLIVGHQPWMGDTLAVLLGIKSESCRIKKGAVWWLRSKERNGEPLTSLVTVQLPDYL